MGEAAAVSALGVTVFLVLRRPTIARRVVVGPALAAGTGVLVMLLSGHVAPADITDAAGVLWRPLVAITAIMLIASSAQHLGALDRVADRVLRRPTGSSHRLFVLVFVLSALSAASLNNDAAILLLTPLVVILVRRRYPDDPAALLPFVFAVFMGAGVAPIVTSNPMNLIVAEYAGLDFNSYAARMIPVAVVGWVVTLAVLWLVFRGTLARLGRTAPGGAAEDLVEETTGWRRREVHGVLLVVGVLAVYPVFALLEVEVWFAAVLGATVGLLLCRHHGTARVGQMLRTGVSWEILVFLVGVFTIAIGLRNAGAVDWLISLYTGADLALVGTVSAVGSALINNHSMALTNLVAIDASHAGAEAAYLAALVGGDLGPRLLPMGSLAGLLWLATLQRMKVDVTVGRFVAVGTVVTVPTLAVSLLVLQVLG